MQTPSKPGSLSTAVSTPSVDFFIIDNTLYWSIILLKFGRPFLKALLNLQIACKLPYKFKTARNADGFETIS